MRWTWMSVCVRIMMRAFNILIEYMGIHSFLIFSAVTWISNKKVVCLDWARWVSQFSSSFCSIAPDKLINESKDLVMPFKTKLTSISSQSRRKWVHITCYHGSIPSDSRQGRRQGGSESQVWRVFQLRGATAWIIIIAYCCSAWKAPILSVSGRR